MLLKKYILQNKNIRSIPSYSNQLSMGRKIQTLFCTTLQPFIKNTTKALSKHNFKCYFLLLHNSNSFFKEEKYEFNFFQFQWNVKTKKTSFIYKIFEILICFRYFLKSHI